MDQLTLRQWRLVKGLTIEDMAAACGVHPNTYAAWEKAPGKISVDNALVIARVFGVSVDAIFFTH